MFGKLVLACSMQYLLLYAAAASAGLLFLIMHLGEATGK